MRTVGTKSQLVEVTKPLLSGQVKFSEWQLVTL